jgi:3-methyladenine DNA glycosylase AlkD
MTMRVIYIYRITLILARGVKQRTANKPNRRSMTAKKFLERLSSHVSAEQRETNQRFYKDKADKKNECLGVRMSVLFGIAKEFMAMPILEIERLLDSRYYEARMGAVSIMDFQARSKKTTDEGRKELYNLYIKRHDRINNWDMVDRSAPHVIGAFLINKPRKVLYKLAKSKNIWERRTAIVSTWFFIKNDEVDDTFNIAEILLNDKEELIHMAVGSWIREAGKREKKKLLAFLDKHATEMPRLMLRYSVEKLDWKVKENYLKKNRD